MQVGDKVRVTAEDLKSIHFNAVGEIIDIWLKEDGEDEEVLYYEVVFYDGPSLLMYPCEVEEF